MSKCVHGLAPQYLSDDITMQVGVRGYDSKSTENMNLYIPLCSREDYNRIVIYREDQFTKA